MSVNVKRLGSGEPGERIGERCGGRASGEQSAHPACQWVASLMGSEFLFPLPCPEVGEMNTRRRGRARRRTWQPGKDWCQPINGVRGSRQGTGDRHTDQASQVFGGRGGDQKKGFARDWRSTRQRRGVADRHDSTVIILTQKIPARVDLGPQSAG